MDFFHFEAQFSADWTSKHTGSILDHMYTTKQLDESMNLHQLQMTLTLFHLRNSNLTSVWPVI